MRHIFLLLIFALCTPLSAQTAEDTATPARNAVVSVGPCSGTLLTSTVVLTVAHCLPERMRARPPSNTGKDTCKGLEQQAKLAHTPWEDPYRWYQLRSPLSVKVGGQQTEDRRQQLEFAVAGYAIARCADLALLRLAKPVPRSYAVPMPVVTSPDAARDLPLEGAPMRYAGWGALNISLAPRTVRATGSVQYVGRNSCHMFALPPLRVTGARILPGDSGSPLLFQSPDGSEALLGVLYGKNILDHTTCGLPSPLPPLEHGTYTPTFRPEIPMTEATDIGRWLEKMVRGLVVF